MSATVRDEAEQRLGRLEELYVRHAPDAVRLAFLLTADRELAQDLAQEAFIRVAGRFRHLRVPDAFGAYLRRTVVNLATSSLRRRSLERSYLKQEGGRARIDEVAEPDLGTRDELRRALHRLPMRQRTAVVLRFYEDLSEQQVADAMKCSVPAARSLVARAMGALRTEIRGDDL